MINRILVPIDFSPVADNAIRHAIEIASKFNSELFLYHVYSFDRFNFDPNFDENEQPHTEKVNHLMNRTKRKFLADLTQKELSFQTIVEQEDISMLFDLKVRKHGIDLIVMGSKGATGLMKVIFGSVAATAIEEAEVPVLVIPPQCSFRPLSRIILAMDNKEVSSLALQVLHKLALAFGAKVTVLSVRKGSHNSEQKKMNLKLEDIETDYHEVPLSKGINKSINEFIDKEDCDLLCMIRREKGFVQSIFTKSITRAQAFNSQVPLLVLPESK